MKKTRENLVGNHRCCNFAYRKFQKQVDLISNLTTRNIDFIYLNLTKEVKKNQS